MQHALFLYGRPKPGVSARLNMLPPLRRTNQFSSSHRKTKTRGLQTKYVRKPSAFARPALRRCTPNSFPSLALQVVRFSLGRLWGSAFGHDSVAPLPIHVPQATKSEIDQVAQLLRGAKRPVLVCGSGSMLCTEDQAHALQVCILFMTFGMLAKVSVYGTDVRTTSCQAAINTIGIPTFLGGMSRGLLGRNNPLHIRQVCDKCVRAPQKKNLGMNVVFAEMNVTVIPPPRCTACCATGARARLETSRCCDSCRGSV